MMTDEEAARLIGLPTATFPSWTQGVLITDTHQDDNPIIYANAGFSRLTGYGLEEILGRNCRFLQGEGSDPGTVARIRQAIAYRRGFQGEILNYRRDGTSFLNQLTIGPARSTEEGRYFIGLQIDVTPAARRPNNTGSS